MTDSKTAEKIYPKRTLKKKPFFDEEPWETVENRKKNSRSKTKKSTDDKAKTNLNENDSNKPYCWKCLLVFKTGQELEKHQEDCLRAEKGEF